jgi:hypothetical protein
LTTDDDVANGLIAVPRLVRDVNAFGASLALKLLTSVCNLRIASAK